MTIIRFILLATFIIFSALLSACSSTPQVVNRSAPIPKDGSIYPGHYKIGSPYRIQNQWYYPQANPDYVEEGMASWYGPGFHGKPTANGDTFDKSAFTAAHRTLPLPSMVKVTNLATNRSAIVMVNDRGPFSRKRILDMSEKTAIALGMKQQGVGKVRVQFLPAETREMLTALHLPPIEGKYATAVSQYREPAFPIATEEGNLLVSPALAGELHPNTATAQYVFIQAGAYSSKDGAEKVARSLSQFGKVAVKPVNAQEKTMYRVRLGPIKSTEDANHLLSKVINLGNTQAIIIGNSS